MGGDDGSARDAEPTTGWKATVVFDLLVPIVLGAALIVILVVAFAATSASGSS